MENETKPNAASEPVKNPNRQWYPKTAVRPFLAERGRTIWMLAYCCTYFFFLSAAISRNTCIIPSTKATATVCCTTVQVFINLHFFFFHSYSMRTWPPYAITEKENGSADEPSSGVTNLTLTLTPTIFTPPGTGLLFCSMFFYVFSHLKDSLGREVSERAPVAARNARGLRLEQVEQPADHLACLQSGSQ